VSGRGYRLLLREFRNYPHRLGLLGVVFCADTGSLRSSTEGFDDEVGRFAATEVLLARDQVPVADCEALP